MRPYEFIRRCERNTVSTSQVEVWAKEAIRLLSEGYENDVLFDVLRAADSFVKRNNLNKISVYGSKRPKHRCVPPSAERSN